MAETPRLAHLVVLVFLGSMSCLAVTLLALVYATVRKASAIAKVASLGALSIVSVYAVVLFGAAAVSPDRTLAPGAWKYFCEVDCHIAYSVQDAQWMATLGSEAKPVPARGRFVVVQVKTWFDPSTIAKFRGNGPLTPSAPRAWLVDETGQRFARSFEGERALSAQGTPLTEPLRPGESYLTNLVFDVSREAHKLRLLITDPDPVVRVLIDGENSPFHGKIYLALPDAVAATAGEP